MKLLLAEDDPLTRRLLQEQLQEWQYDVSTTATGTDALKALCQPDGPKLAILDWQMPGLSGVEVCKQIRGLKSGTYIYIVMLTGMNEKRQVVEGLQAGADDYLTKPCNPYELQVRLLNGQRILNLEAELLATMAAIKNQQTLDTSLHYFDKLTGREVEILRLAVTGATDEDIARTFHLGPDWVHAHFANILFKMQVSTRAEAVSQAKADGVLNQRKASPVFAQLSQMFN